MTSKLAGWLFRKAVEKHIIGFIYIGEGLPPVPGTILGASEVEAIFRD